MGLNKKSSILTEFWLILINLILLALTIGTMYFLSNSRDDEREKSGILLSSNVYLSSLTLNFLNQKIEIKDIPQEFKKEAVEFLSEKEFYEIRELYYFFTYIQDDKKKQNFLTFLQEKRKNFLEDKEKSLEKFYSFLEGVEMDERSLEYYKNRFVKLSGFTLCNTVEYVVQASSYEIKRNIISQFHFVNYIQFDNEFKLDKNIICFSA